ncbi:MAG TPA: helix-turn-helix transcriptional regulator [Longilinea sp.]|nr:helix-turn-helix transcriptional regulator [Longilinea sp.]
MTVQVIENKGKPEWAVLPYSAYLELVEQAEMLQDLRDYDSAKAALASGEEELIPSEVVYALLDGANPIKVWREYRKISQQDLARFSGISIPYLSQLESGKRKGSIEVFSAIAKALSLSIDDLVVTE